MCMWAPQLLSYCDPILVHGVGGTFSGGKLQKHKGFLFFPFILSFPYSLLLHRLHL